MSDIEEKDTSNEKNIEENEAQKQEELSKNEKNHESSKYLLTQP